MARKLASWKNDSHSFYSEMNATKELQEKAVTVKVQTVGAKIESLQKEFISSKITFDKLTTELSKLYINSFIAASMTEDEIEKSDKMKLYYAHEVISGESSKRDRRKNILFHLVTT